MNLHFLVNLSSETENLFGVQFFCSFFKETPPCNVTLFHICLLENNNAAQPLTEMWENPDKRIEGKLTAGARRALDKATRSLQGNKVIVDKMKTKTVEERFGKVKDILAEGEAGLYDAIILGRRASYALQWIFDRAAEEIPLALIKDTSLKCPLWVCCEPEPGRKNVLLCVDGSESALRAADHVGYILSFAQQHNVTVFNVSLSPTKTADAILQEAVEILHKHNIAPSRITSKSTWGISVPGTILSEKNSGKYAAVALGLHGVSNGVLENFGLMGGTTATLISKISKAALWCCP